VPLFMIFNIFFLQLQNWALQFYSVFGRFRTLPAIFFRVLPHFSAFSSCMIILVASYFIKSVSGTSHFSKTLFTYLYKSSLASLSALPSISSNYWICMSMWLKCSL
jgi:hypothetical protein